MKTSKRVSNRAQPRFGTILRLSIECAASADEADMQRTFDRAFAEAVRLEEIFNFHSPTSELTRFNDRQPGREFRLSSELEELLAFARHLHEISGGVFDPIHEGRYDLSGVAKGFIVDRLSQMLEAVPGFSGVIDAGGDLRFYGRPVDEPRVHVRVGSPDDPKVHQLRLDRFTSVATSGPQALAINTKSSTRYRTPPLKTASIVAHNCATADAMTKIALFGTSEQIESCCEELDAVAFIFDAEGTLREAYGVA